MKEATSHSFRVNTGILIVDFYEPDNTEKQFYDIAPLGLLAQTMQNAPDRSQLLFHISGKKWASLPLLYDLAAKINFYCPNHGINWKKSFLPIELDRIASKYVRETFVPSQTDPIDLAEGELSWPDSLAATMASIKYQSDIGEEVTLATRQKIGRELTKRGIH